MPGARKAVIHKKTRLFDDFFKIDEVIVSHERRDGTMSPDERRLIFERGDAVAIMLYNVDTKSVILVNQFKVPSLIGRKRDNPETMDGWITEATAGMIDPGETAEAAIKRETKEETGYSINNPELICKFFSSPGGTSERISLYFAEVRESDKVSDGGGLPGEDITVVRVPLNELFDLLEKGEIDDPKLAIGAYWLKDRLKDVVQSERLVESVQTVVDDVFGRLTRGSISNPKLTAAARWLHEHLPQREPEAVAAAAAGAVNRPAAAARSPALTYSSVCYALTDRPELTVGYITGPIKDISGISLWVNSENTDMLMDRVFGRSISSQIRRMGSNTDDEGNIIEDTIAEALRTAVGPRGHVRIGSVLVTESGSLKATHGVERILHVASVQASLDGGVRANLDTLATCVKRVLERAERINKRNWNTFANLLRQWLGLKPRYCESILIPTIGAGDGGLSIEQVTQAIIPAAVEHLRSAKLPTLKAVYFIAYDQRAKDACDAVLNESMVAGKLAKTDCK
jgi:nudix-type nucleoside diphosphatase (YffH/AdpP family)